VKIRFIVAYLAVGALPLTSCGKSTGSGSPTLQNAESARVSESAANSSIIAAGTRFSLGDVRITASNPRLGGDDDGPWITFDVKIENLGKVDTDAFNPGVACAGQYNHGGYQADSTLKILSGFPPKSVDTGTVNFLPPNDSRSGDVGKACATPAYAVFDPMETLNGVPKPVWVPIPDSVVQSYNAGLVKAAASTG
jgi:hypothetical protein